MIELYYKTQAKTKRSAPYTITSITDLVFYQRNQNQNSIFCQQFLLYYLHETPPSSGGERGMPLIIKVSLTP